MNTNYDMLVIEFMFATPHLETSIEIAIKESSRKKVLFCCVDFGDYDSAIPYKTKLIGGNKKRKFIQTKKILREFDIDSVYICKKYNNNLNISKIQEFEHIQDLMFNNYNIGVGICSSIISRLGTIDPDRSEYLKLLPGYVRSSVAATIVSEEIIRRYRPSAILIFNGRYAVPWAISQVAKYFNVYILYHERGANASRYWCSRYSPHDLDYRRQLIDDLWKKSIEDKVSIGKSFFSKRKSGDGIGWLSFSGDQRKGLVPAKKNIKRFVYFTSSEDEYAALFMYFKNKLFRNQRDAILYLINYFSSIENSELIIRVHPHLELKNEKDRIWWNSLKGRNCTVIESSSKVSSYELLESADGIITYHSTMGAEAAYWGKASIVLGDSLVKGMGCVYEPNTISELENMLSRNQLTPLGSDKVIPFGYYSMRFGNEFQYYIAKDLFEGEVCGILLSYHMLWYRFAKKAIWRILNILNRK